MAACSAQIGSTSVMITRAPWPRSESAQPLPTSPYPQTTATLPPISTSVARFKPSIKEWRQPYLLSNFDLVTESLTLMAGNSRALLRCISYNRCTPVVVSSVTPTMALATSVQSRPSAIDFFSSLRTTWNSSESSSVGSGTSPALVNSTPLCTSRVASPPSSKIMFANSARRTGWSSLRSGSSSPSGQLRICSVHHQYSSRLSPFQAKTGTPAGSSTDPSGPTTTAAAAWSWVEKMLQLAQRTSAPRATRVSISTAVCTVMCSEPATRAPASGLLSPC